MSAIVTFYAPGGTSSYASEVAAVTRLLLERKQRVLAVDWDLAPRLSRGLSRHTDASKPGLLDLLLARMEEEPELDWRGLRVRFEEAPGADLLPAGGASWSASDFRWSSFYESHGGGTYLERLRDEWSTSYDVVLIHCPAGSDEEGVCTVQMADALALVFELGGPSAGEAVHSVQRRQEARQQLAYDRMPLQILPIPVVTGADPREEDLRLHEAALWLAPCLRDWLPGGLSPRDALESLRFDADPSRNERSCLLISELILCDFQNAAKRIPPPAKPEQPFENELERLARAPLSYLKVDLSVLSKLATTLHARGGYSVLGVRHRVLDPEFPDILSVMAEEDDEEPPDILSEMSGSRK